MAAGRSFEQVEEMTLFDLQMIFDYWQKCPPANEILAAVYQVKPDEKRKKASSDELQTEGYLSIEELREQFNAHGGLKLVSNNG